MKQDDRVYFLQSKKINYLGNIIIYKRKMGSTCNLQIITSGQKTPDTC